MTGHDLPSLTALRAFEAAARHESVSQAAAELFLTHGAVSRQVRLLEEALGLDLFERRGRRLALTPAGRTLAAACTEGLGTIAAAVATLRRAETAPSVRVACSGTVLMRWLIPRLPGFYAAAPDVSVQLIMTSEAEALLPGGCDVAISWFAPSLPRDRAASVEALMPDRIGPVCAPRLAAGGKSDALLQGTILHAETEPEAWAIWQRAVGKRAAPAAEHRYEHFYLALEAAEAGLGLAIASAALVADDLAEGKLAAPFGFVASPRPFELARVHPPGSHPASDRFVAWLTAEAAAAAE